MPKAMAERLKAAGAVFAPWPATTAEAETAPGEDETMIRLVASFATTEEHVDAFLNAAA